MAEKSGDSVDWDLCTWEGARRESLRRWASLPLERIIAALEEMQELGQGFQAKGVGGAVLEQKGGYDGIANSSKRVSADGMDFSEAFRCLTGHGEFRWQARLYAQLVENEEQWPKALDLPTGLGKTSVMAIWLLARAVNEQLPRRLIYIVDRRTVVDQATREAEKLRNAIEKDELRGIRNRLGLADRCLPISTLRGAHIDNREWLADPAAPAIVIGTVDMIGSRLLFDGYGVSRGMRPYHAGLLGADAFFVLDEAHLCPPFEALLESVQKLQRSDGNDNRQRIPMFHLLTLSATGRRCDGEDVFSLQDEDYKDEPVGNRLRSKKSLAVCALGLEEKLEDVLSSLAWMKRGRNNRVLVYCGSRKCAQQVYRKISSLAKRERTGVQIELMVGARRVFERERLASWLEQTGFVSGSDVTRDAPVFLVATSAGEVGVDIDADHMVCDLVPFERMVQRFGRVNRLGMGQADIEVLAEPPRKGKLDKPRCPADPGLAKPVMPEKPGREASKEEHAEYKKKGTAYRKALKIYETGMKKYAREMENYRKALRKYETEWRQYHAFEACLALLKALQGDASPGALITLKEHAEHDRQLAKWMELACTPLLLRPALTLPLVESWSMTSLREHTGRPDIGPWLRGWIDEKPQSMIAWRKHLPWNDDGETLDSDAIEAFFDAAPIHVLETLETYTHEIVDMLIKRAQAVLQSGEYDTKQPVLMILGTAGDLCGVYRLGELADGTKKKTLEMELAGNRCVAASLLGGLDDSGLLDPKRDSVPGMFDSGWDEKVLDNIGYRVAAAEEDINGEWCIVYRHAVQLPDNDEDTDASMIVVGALRRTGVGRAGDPAVARREQRLDEHLAWAGEAARTIGKRLGLPEDYIRMLVVAARAHDLGKAREQWQNAMNAPIDGRPYAKTKAGGNPRMLNGYRHEFGSLGDAMDDDELAALPEPLRELALHLIASHHGYARPAIPAIDPDTPPSLLAERVGMVALRFARLQREWGPWGLAWWEAIFRAADWQASARLDVIEPGGRG